MAELIDSFTVDSQNSDNYFKLAMFNALAVVIVVTGAVTLICVYFILEPFIKPLAWALLIGSALHPFKEAIATECRSQVVGLERSGRPVYINLLLMPFLSVDRFSDIIGDFFVYYSISIGKVLASIATTFGLYYYTPSFVWKILTYIVKFNKHVLILILDTFNNTIFVGSVVAGFFVTLLLAWNPSRHQFFSYGSFVVWIALTAWFANFSSFARLAIFAVTQALVFGGGLYSALRSSNETPDAIRHTDFDGKGQIIQAGPTSFVCIRYLMISCFSVLLFSIPMFLYVLLLLLTFYSIKRICIHFGFVDAICSYIDISRFNIRYGERKIILLPPPFVILFKLVQKWQTMILDILKESCDSLAAVAVILCLIVFCLFFSVFFTFHAYKEGVYLVQVGGSIINSTIVNNPELKHLVPKDWQTTKNAALENAYVYARDSSLQFIRSFLEGKGLPEEKSMQLEEGVIELWDKAYEAWLRPPMTVGQDGNPDAFFHSVTSFVERLKKTPEVISWDLIWSLVQENMSTLNTGLESLWLILKGNLSLLIRIFSTLFSILFDGSLSVINFIIHTVVFLTSLFYLLSTSRKTYKPVEMITELSPEWGNRLALAVENSCREVLAASMKLSLFYGLWTWLIHTIFMSNLIYIPAALAAVLGAVPVLGTYWVCLPAILDIWLLQNSKARALGLFLAQLFPTIAIETIVYNEIKGGGHPYLTGLSIAGGMFWLGIEGAIVGPLVLCFIFTAINMISSFKSNVSS